MEIAADQAIAASGGNAREAVKSLTMMETILHILSKDVGEKPPKRAKRKGCDLPIRPAFGVGHSLTLRTSPRQSTSDFRVSVSRRSESAAT